MDVIAILALALSLASLAWHVITWRRDGPKLVVEIGCASIVNSKLDFALTVTIINTGRSPTKIRRCYFKEQGGARWADLLSFNNERRIGPNFPVIIEPDDRVFFAVSLSEVRAQLVSSRPGDEVWLYAIAEYGKRRATSPRRRSKLVYLNHDHGHGTPQSRLSRIRANIRPRWWAQLAGFVNDKSGNLNGDYAVKAYNVGWLPMWRPQVVTTCDRFEEMTDSEKDLLKRSTFKRLLLFRWQVWNLKVPEELQDLAENYQLIFQPLGGLGGAGVPSRTSVDRHRQLLKQHAPSESSNRSRVR